ncbi:MAG TPA: MarR family winged helix-turn-helix transcriptional regulator [Thermoleophilia bacterium]|nr:MarR family winged helix-turn-helix transcriptional regulator [Thermoleophilia bacterium]
MGREGDPEDARGAVLVLTESGWSEIRRAAPLHVESVRRHFIDLLSRAQIEVLGDVAETVAATSTWGGKSDASGRGGDDQVADRGELAPAA